MRIRKETPDDFQAIRKIHIAAFQSDAEANLVENLRASGLALIALLAEESGLPAGHILFSPVRLKGGDDKLFLYGLGPLGVLPERQKQGIGSALVEEGLRQCGLAGIDAVVVLGHPDYYPRFGFESSRKYGIQCEYNVPEHFFTIRELKKGCLKNAKGTIVYHGAFREV